MLGFDANYAGGHYEMGMVKVQTGEAGALFQSSMALFSSGRAGANDEAIVRPAIAANLGTTFKELLVGFFVGCVAAAAAVTYLGDWAWSFPAALAAVAVALSEGDEIKILRDNMPFGRAA